MLNKLKLSDVATPKARNKIYRSIIKRKRFTANGITVVLNKDYLIVGIIRREPKPTDQFVHFALAGLVMQRMGVFDRTDFNVLRTNMGK